MGKITLIILLALLSGLLTGLVLSVFFYPKWEMIRLLRHQKKQGYSFGAWNHLKILADHHMRIIVKPNCETLYSSCFIRRYDGPYVLRMPAFDAYYSFAFLNMNTDVTGYITNRDAREHVPNEFIIAYTPEDMQRTNLQGIRLNNRISWIIGRFEIKNPEDVTRVNQVQEGIELISLKDYLYEQGKKG